MLGLVGLIAAAAQALTGPFLVAPSTLGLHGVLIAVTVLGSVALLAMPTRALTRTASHVALGAAITVQTGTAAATGTIASPYLSGFVALVLAAALFASWRTVLLTLTVTILGLLALAAVDLDLSGSDAAGIVSLGMICALVGSTSSLLAAGQRHQLRRAERRLRLSQRQASLRQTEALTDPLTGVGNRRAFDHDLAAALIDRRANGLLLVMVDVDGLKMVNDTLGHPVGDRVLQAIAGALRSRLRTEDRVYRLGGDEFAALSTSRNPMALETRLGHHIEADVPDAGRRRASVGVARAQPGDEPSSITSRADAALYETKRQSAGNVATPR
jgi:diguanylate cyclase (GGDEF)-like protein